MHMSAGRPRNIVVAVLAAVTVGTALTLAGCIAADPSASSVSSSAPGSASSGAPTGTATSATTSASVAPLTATDDKAAVTLTWWTGQEADAEKTLEGLAAGFTALHPNVTIKTSAGAPTTDELLQKLAAGFAAGTYPDVSYAFGSWASELADSDKTLDVSGSVTEPAARWEEFSVGARKTAKPDGSSRTIGLPAVVGNLGLIYNKTVFDAAGVAYPTKDWTWDDFRTAAKKLTNPAKNIYGTAMAVNGSEDTTWHMWPQLWQNGGEVLTTDGAKAAFNSDAGVAAVGYWRDLAQTDKSVYLDQTGEKYGNLFVSNNIGMLITGPWQLYDLVQGKTKYGVTVLPAGASGAHQTVGATDLWVLFDHQDANRGYWSYEFAKWLTLPEQDARWNIGLGNLPLRAVEKTSQAFIDAAASQPGLDVFVDNLANVTKPRPTVKGYVGLSSAFGAAVARILQGKGDPKAELDKAAVAADRALSGA